MSSDPTLRELATKAITDACPTEEQCHTASALSTAGDCLSAHPIHVSGESNGAIFLVEGEPQALADVVLAAVLPAHREQVLREATNAIEAAPFDLRVSSFPDMGGYWRPETVTNALAALSNPAPKE
jgi:hypothetical protein